MKRLFSILPVLIMLVGVIFGWVFGIGSMAAAAIRESNVEASIAQNEELKTYKNVIDQYDIAIKAHPDDIEWYKRKANAYLEMEWYKSYLEECNRITRTFPSDSWAYQQLMKYYVDDNDYQNVFALYNELSDTLKEDEELKKSFEQYEFEYRYLSSAYDAADPLFVGFAVVGSEGTMGYIDATGKRLFDQRFTLAHPLYDKSGAVKQGDEWFLVDKDGDRIHASNDKIEDLYSPNDGFTLAKVEGKYGYYDENLQNPQHFEYDDGTSFVNGIAAVKQGDTWKLIDTSFNQVGQTSFKDVLVDYTHTCARKQRVFAKQNEKYQLYDSSGNRIGNEEFDDARSFSDEFAAVCQGGKWGFVNREGEVVIPCTYEGAESFNLGIAPVKTGGLWGFIDTSQKVVVEPSFDWASAVSNEGVSLTGNEASRRYIQFYKFTIDGAK